MRRIRLLLVAAVAVLGLFGFAGPAAAQSTDGGAGSTEVAAPAAPAADGEGNYADHAAEHCAHLLAEGKTVDDCQAAPNPLLPETNEIIWGSFGFVVVFFFLWKMGYPAIKKTMDARTERIRKDLEDSEQAKSDASQVLVEYRAQLADAKNEAGRIIEEARQQADSLRRDQEQRLQTDLATMRERATADVEAAKVQAIADLRGEVATLAIGAAEAVVAQSLDRQTQTQLVDDYINRVTAGN